MMIIEVNDDTVIASIIFNDTMVTSWEKKSQPMPEGEQPVRVCGACDTIKEEVE